MTPHAGPFNIIFEKAFHMQSAWGGFASYPMEWSFFNSKVSTMGTSTWRCVGGWRGSEQYCCFPEGCQQKQCLPACEKGNTGLCLLWHKDNSEDMPSETRAAVATPTKRGCWSTFCTFFCSWLGAEPSTFYLDNCKTTALNYVCMQIRAHVGRKNKAQRSEEMLLFQFSQIAALH